jgi:hypothetical protein
MESRAAARAMLYAMEAESNFIEVHHEIVGFGASPDCSCRACRDKWSKATPDERAAADLSLQIYLDRACSRTEKALQPAVFDE